MSLVNHKGAYNNPAVKIRMHGQGVRWSSGQDNGAICQFCRYHKMHFNIHYECADPFVIVKYYFEISDEIRYAHNISIDLYIQEWFSITKA